MILTFGGGGKEQNVWAVKGNGSKTVSMGILAPDGMHLGGPLPQQ